MKGQPYTAKPLRKTRPGSIVYLRCVVIGPNDLGPFVAPADGPVAQIAVANRFGEPADECRFFVPESQLITMAEAYRSVREKAT